MDYEKMWNTLRAESGGRWCQPHPLSNELLTIGELMRNMEHRASEPVETKPEQHTTPQGQNGTAGKPQVGECTTSAIA